MLCTCVDVYSPRADVIGHILVVNKVVWRGQNSLPDKLTDMKIEALGSLYIQIGGKPSAGRLFVYCLL